MNTPLIDSPPSRFKYPLKIVTIAIKLVVIGLLSLRGVERAFAIFEYSFRCEIPSHTVIQNWVMRYGLYQLKKIPKKRDDWIFILDHSIEFGKKQCLLVLGVSLEKFHKNNHKLHHEDMEVLAIDIIESATGKSVTNTLNKIAKNTGIPAQIVSDGGLNIINGCNDFIEQKKDKKQVLKTYDVTHAMALILKHQLKNDLRWQEFCKKTAETKRCLIHTNLGYLSPRKPRDKSRWQNLDIYVKWGEMILNQKLKSISKTEAERFKEKLSWIKEYKKDIKEWRAMLSILDAVKKEVKKNGINKSTEDNFKKSTQFLTLKTPRLITVYNHSLQYIEKECLNLDEGFLGCSDIIESIFGKYKNFSGKSPIKEIGRSILTIPAFTRKINSEEVNNAMQNISAQDVIDWQAENIGTSLLTKRKKAFATLKTKN